MCIIMDMAVRSSTRRACFVTGYVLVPISEARSIKVVTSFDPKGNVRTTIDDHQDRTATSLFVSGDDNDEVEGDACMQSAHVVLAQELQAERSAEPLPKAPSPPSYLWLSILAAIFCNPFIGIIAVVKSCQSKQAMLTNRRAVAKMRGDEAMIIGVVTVIIGCAIWTFLGVFFWVRSIWGDGWQ
jgi:hypothetical protein